MSNAKQILALLESRAEGDDEQFYSIALQVAAAEARQGRRSTADAIRRAVESARSAPASKAVPIQFAKPRGDLEGLLGLRDPRYVLKDVVLSNTLQNQLNDILRQQHKRQWLREHSQTPSKRLLFVGPPGSGKTMTAEALAGELRLPIFVIRLESMITRFMGETAAKLRLIFDETATKRGIYLFDEFDAVGGRRNATNDVAEMRRVLNSFLQFMEEDNSTDSVIIGATNHPQLLDDALIRRFDTVLNFDMPSDDDIKRVILKNLGAFKAGRLAWAKITPAARGLSQAEISKAVGDAVKAAILDERKTISTDQLLMQLQQRRQMQTAFKHSTAT